MTYHVFPGDSLAADFPKINIEGDVIVCRECLVTGDLSGKTLDEFWQSRANFLMVEYVGDEIDYFDDVAGELSKLLDLPQQSEVNLWFEYELFCNVNMWFCLDLLKDSDVEIYRVEPVVRDEEDLWKGFGNLPTDDLKKCYASRQKFTRDDIRLGSDLWRAFKSSDKEKLLELSKANSSCFPYLKKVCNAAREKETRPLEILQEIKDEGIAGFENVFPEFNKRAGVYGFGDNHVRNLINAC